LAGLGGVTHRLFTVDLVAVASADADTVDVAGFDKLADDPLSCSLGDSYGFCNVSDANVRVTSNTEEHLAVVGEKRPAMFVGQA
jgi:hypothetical protein